MTTPVDVLAILEHEADGWDCDTPEYNKIMQARTQVAALIAENAELRQRVEVVAGEMREESRERKIEDRAVGIFADPQSAALLDEWADRLTKEKSE